MMNKTMTIEEKILKALRARKTLVGARDLAKKINHPVQSVRRALLGLNKTGKVYRNGMTPFQYYISRAA